MHGPITDREIKGTHQCRHVLTIKRPVEENRTMEVEQAAFENLKAAFVSQPVLVIPDYSKPFVIKADTSLFATGVVLLQEDSNGEEHLAGYLSHSLTPAEQNYQVYDVTHMFVPERNPWSQAHLLQTTLSTPLPGYLNTQTISPTIH